MKRLNKKNIIIITVGVIVCVTLYFSINAIMNKTIPTKIHDKLVKDIRISAYRYGLDNVEYFKQGYEMYVSVDSLITNGYLKSNDNQHNLYIDNLTNKPFLGIVYIYYKDDKVHTEYLENYSDSEKQELLKKDLNISLNNVTSSSINISVNSKNLLINKYEYYLNDLKVDTSTNNQYNFNGLLYGEYRIKVIAHADNASYEDNAIISLNKIVLPTFEFANNILSIIYPDNINNYVYDYSFDEINWTKTVNQIEQINVTNDCSVTARVSDGYNYVTANKNLIGIGVSDLPKRSYNVTFDLNGGTGNISNQIVQEGNSVNKPSDPKKSGYEFIGWHNEGNLYHFSTSIYKDITLKAQYKIITQEQPYQSVTPILKYNFSSQSTGKWLFINNPERLYKEYLTDNSGKVLYSNYINGTAEIYYEHYVQSELSLGVNYGIRFYNPNSSTVSLKINKCGSSLVRGDGNIYIDTWKEYYGFKNCSMNGKIFSILPNDSVTIYIDAYSTGTGWSDWDSNYTTSVPSKSIPESIIDGVFNVTSSGKLNVETFIFKDINTVPNVSYSDSDNYIDTMYNKLVYSGYYNKLPYLIADIKFDITDTTSVGPLKIKYNENSSERDTWFTHNLNGDVLKSDAIKPITNNNPVTNWGNWAVHYTENIIINNTTSKNKRIAYYVNSVYAGESGSGSAIVAFPKDNSLNYIYKRSVIGKWHTDNDFENIWTVVVPANTQVTIPTEVLLGGNSVGTIGRKVELLN